MFLIEFCQRNEGYAGNVQTFIMKSVINIVYKMFKTTFVDNVLQIFVLEMFYKHLIATGYHTHHFKTSFKQFLSNIVTTFYHKCFLYPYFQNVY